MSNTAIAVGFRQARVDLESQGIIPDCPLKVAAVLSSHAAIVISQSHTGVEGDRQIEIGNRSIKVASGIALLGAVEIACRRAGCLCLHHYGGKSYGQDTSLHTDLRHPEIVWGQRTNLS